MRIWMEERAEEKDHFAAGVTLSIIGLTAAAIAVPCGIAVLTLILDGPVKEISMAACLGAVALVIFLARKIGSKVHQYCTVFCQDDEGRFFCSGCPEICRLWQRRNRIYTDAFPDAESKEKHEREPYPGAVYASGTQSYWGRDADSFGGQDENDGQRIPGEVSGRVSE